MKYYICEYCGKAKKRIGKKKPKCKCPDGNGKTFMNLLSKKVYKNFVKNK